MSNQPYEGPQGFHEGEEPQQRYAYPYPEEQQYRQGQQYQQEPQHQQGQQFQQGQQYQQESQYGRPHPETGAQSWPAQTAAPVYEEPSAAEQTQQWQGQTWETQSQPQVSPEVSLTETSYMPPVAEPHAYASQQQRQAQAPQAQAPQAQVQAPQHQAYAPLPEAAAAEAPGAVDAPLVDVAAYGPPTVGGNTRFTDAQRARAEGRSPVIEPGMQPAALTALLALLLSGTAALGSFALVVPLVVLQAVTAAGWFRLNGMWPARQGIALAFAGALVADVAVLAAGRDDAVTAVLGTLGVWVLLTLVLQLRSHADPDERMYGLMASLASAALAVLATGYLAAEPEAVTVGALAVAVGILVRALPLPTRAAVVASLVAGGAVGALAGGLAGEAPSGALLGAGAVLCALIGHRVASYDYPSRFVHFTAGVALPLAAAVPAVYLFGGVFA